MPDGRQRWHEQAVEELLSEEDVPVLFLARCEDSIVGFLSQFDEVVLLRTPVDHADGEPYGKRPGEL
jgi:hypothetical protein